jgi:hypothetical protein
MNYTGSYQDEETTQKRINNGECYVLLDDEKLIGTITLVRHSRFYAGKEVWYDAPRSHSAVNSL